MPIMFNFGRFRAVEPVFAGKHRAVRLPEVKQSMDSALVDATASTAGELAQIIATEIPRWGSVRKAGDIKPQDR